MTDNRKFKNAIRARMAATGETYNVARRILLNPRTTGASSSGSAAPAPRSLWQMLRQDVAGEAERLVGEDLGKLGNLEDLWDGLHLTQPQLQGIEVDQRGIVIELMDRYEGGTCAYNITAPAVIVFDALMDKAAAIQAEGAGQLEFMDFDWSDHEAQVQVSPGVSIELSFVAIATPGSESIESLAFVGATT